MQRRTLNLVMLALLLTMTVSITGISLTDAQAGNPVMTPTPTQVIDPNLVISYPPPVYVLRGQVEIRGTANLRGMVNYFLEFRPLAEDMSVINPNATWVPASLPSRGPVQEDVLGIWNTQTAPDGLYELRLTANVPGSAAHSFRVAPLRIENQPPPFVQATISITPFTRFNTPTPINSRPTLAATPTAFIGGPTVTALTDSNVRQGDSVIYPVVGSLLTGQTAQIIGISATGSGWLYIQLNTGRRGFISPAIVSVNGDIDNLDRIFPPATPTPTFTPTPPFTGDLIINGGTTSPDRPRCNEQFEAQVNVTNIGSSSTISTFVVRIQDIDVQSNTVTASAAYTVPILIAPGQNFVAPVPITVNSFPDRDHRIVATVDANNQVVEENEGNNTFSFTYHLRQGTCP